MRALEQQADSAAHWAEREYDALFAPEAPRRIALIADDENRVTGFLIARADLDEWELENVVVTPERRRGGHWRRLVPANCSTKLNARKPLRCCWRSGSPTSAARQLYEKFGFIEAGRRPELL